MARILIIRKHKTNNMKRYYILAFYILLVAGTATAQEETISLTLQQAIEIAQEHRRKPKLHDTLIVQLTGTTASSVQTICRPLR